MSSPVEGTAHQPGHPNLKVGSSDWVKGGPSPNPGGKTPYQRALEEAIAKQESPERVCAVVAAMHEDATAHEKYSPAAAKVYFQAVGLNLNREQPVNLDGVSDAALAELRTVLRQ